MAFRRIFVDSTTEIGFEKEDDTWLRAYILDGGVYIDKAYLSSEPSLSIKQARKFADKIIGFCNKIEIEKQRK